MESVFDSVQTSGKSDYQLDVTLLESERHGTFWFGIGNETTHAAMSWKLTDRNGKMLWTKTIESKFSLGMLEEFSHDERKRMANEGAVRGNINQAVQAISQLSF
jgi:hypothetical protein